MPPEDSKPWWQSQTVIAGITTVIVSLAGMLGYQVSSEDAVELPVLIGTAVTTLAGIWAIIGRVLATKSLVGGNKPLTASQIKIARQVAKELKQQ